MAKYTDSLTAIYGTDSETGDAPIMADSDGNLPVGYKGYTTTKSGQITVGSAGTAVQGDDEAGSLFLIKAHPDNTDSMWVGNDGADDVANDSGVPLNPGEAIVLNMANLNQIFVDADVDDEKVCWIKLA